MNVTHMLAILAVVAGPAPAIAQGMNMAPGMTMAPAANGDAADKALADSMQKMMKDMGTPPTGDPDRDFVTMMIPHHQGAIDMAKAELMYGKDPAIRKLATSIVAAQTKEIAEMNAWLNQHRKK